jgi:hypothetical protein
LRGKSLARKRDVVAFYSLLGRVNPLSWLAVR